MHGCMDVWMYGCMHGCMDAWMHGRMDGCMYVYYNIMRVYIYTYILTTIRTVTITPMMINIVIVTLTRRVTILYIQLYLYIFISWRYVSNTNLSISYFPADPPGIPGGGMPGGMPGIPGGTMPLRFAFSDLSKAKNYWGVEQTTDYFLGVDLLICFLVNDALFSKSISDA